MKLLICTQAIDRNDPYLGFFEQWVAELATHYSEVLVLCLRVGEHTLPHNVKVVSLGSNKVQRAIHLLWYSVARRFTYDAVFVHMSQEFVLVAGWLWTLLCKPIYLWRNHYSGSVLTALAAQFCKKVFYTSNYSYTARYNHAVRMPVGVALSEVHVARQPGTVLFFGRLAESKHPEVLIEALALMPQAPRAVFCGPGDPKYVAALQKQADARGVVATFKPGIPHREAAALFASAEVYVNAARSGMFDKTIFEAAAVGTVPLASSKDWQAYIPELYFEGPQALAERLTWYRALPDTERELLGKRLRALAKEHSLPVLALRLAEAMQYDSK